MAKSVTVQVLGGQPKVLDVDSVKQAMDALSLSGSFAATVNGDPVSDLETELEDFNHVYFAPAVKGGSK